MVQGERFTIAVLVAMNGGLSSRDAIKGWYDGETGMGIAVIGRTEWQKTTTTKKLV